MGTFLVVASNLATTTEVAPGTANRHHERGRSHPRIHAHDVPAFGGDGATGVERMLVVVATWIALGAVAAVVGNALGDSTGIDRSVSDWFVDQRRHALDGVTRLFSLAGDTFIVIPIALAVIIVGFVRRRHDGLIVLVVGMIGEVTIFLTLTAIVSRARPDVAQLDGAPPTSSFPSGHTFAAILLWGTLAVVAERDRWSPWLQRCFVVLAFVMPLGIGLSRLYRGMHHFTDVLASLVLGVVWLAVVIRTFPASALRESIRHRDQVDA